jgi:hypothetical protein
MGGTSLARAAGGTSEAGGVARASGRSPGGVLAIEPSGAAAGRLTLVSWPGQTSIGWERTPLGPLTRRMWRPGGTFEIRTGARLATTPSISTRMPTASVRISTAPDEVAASDRPCVSGSQVPGTVVEGLEAMPAVGRAAREASVSDGSCSAGSTDAGVGSEGGRRTSVASTGGAFRPDSSLETSGALCGRTGPGSRPRETACNSRSGTRPMRVHPCDTHSTSVRGTGECTISHAPLTRTDMATTVVTNFRAAFAKSRKGRDGSSLFSRRERSVRARSSEGPRPSASDLPGR